MSNPFWVIVLKQIFISLLCECAFASFEHACSRIAKEYLKMCLKPEFWHLHGCQLEGVGHQRYRVKARVGSGKPTVELAAAEAYWDSSLRPVIFGNLSE